MVDEQGGHGQVEVAFEVLLDAADPSDVQIAAAAEPSLETPGTDGAGDSLAEGPARSGRSTPPRTAVTATPPASTDGVRAYLAEIARIPLLDAAEEAALAQRVQDGLAARALLHTASEPGERAAPEELARLRHVAHEGQLATERMVEANLRLVVSVARRYLMSGVPLLDLIQDGNLGLMRAVEKFDPARGFKFSTYGTWWIRQACLRAVMLRRHVRLPDEVHRQVQRLRRTAVELAEQAGVAPTNAQLAERLGLPEDRVAELRALESDAVSLSLPLGTDGSDATLADVLADDESLPLPEQVFVAHLPAALARVLATLPERERQVVELRFGLDRTEPRTLEDIAREFGVTARRVQQLQVRAMAKLRRNPDIQGLRAD